MPASPVRPFVKRTEDLIQPPEVGIISLFGGFLGLLPVALQKRIMEGSTQKNPYMGFVVDPYAFFLCHEITDLEGTQRLLPDDFRIVPTAVFEGDEPKPTVIFGAFNVHTSAFWGNRVEMYVIAEHKPSGLLGWVIVDYDSNTLSFDPGQGFEGPATSRSVVTTTHRAEVLVDVVTDTRRIAAVADLEKAISRPLDPRLWVEGNLCVGYGGTLGDGGDPFGLLFDPGEMEKALEIPLDAVELQELTWHPGLYDPTPHRVAVFPYAQHFITSQVPTQAQVTTPEGLDGFVRRFVEGPAPKGFSSSAIKTSMFIGWCISTTLTLSMAAWIVVHLMSGHGH